MTSTLSFPVYEVIIDGQPVEVMHTPAADLGDFTAVFIDHERSSPDRFAKISFGSGV